MVWGLGKMKKVLLFVTVILFALTASGAFAGEQILIDADRQFNYAETLYSEGDYFLAIPEYRRFVHFFPRDERVEEAEYKTGLAWFKGGNYRQALRIFLDFTEKSPDTLFFAEAYFMTARCYEKLNDGKDALIYLNNLSKLSDESGVRDRAFYQSGLIYLDMGMWERALNSFAAISETPSATGEKNGDLFAYEKIKRALEERDRIKRKSPGLAGSLAVIPGAGYLYLNMYRNALVSFLLNGGFILAASESFADDNYALGGLISFVGFGFYAGNIYGSISGAHKYNRNEERKFIRSVKGKVGLLSKVTLSGGVMKEGPCLALSYRF